MCHRDAFRGRAERRPLSPPVAAAQTVDVASRLPRDVCPSPVTGGWKLENLEQGADVPSTREPQRGDPGLCWVPGCTPCLPFLPVSRCSPVSVLSPGYGSSTSVGLSFDPPEPRAVPAAGGRPPSRPQTGSHPSVSLGLTGLPRRQRASRPPWLRRQARRGAVLTSTHRLVLWASSCTSERSLRRQEGEWNRSPPEAHSRRNWQGRPRCPREITSLAPICTLSAPTLCRALLDPHQGQQDEVTTALQL